MANITMLRRISADGSGIYIMPLAVVVCLYRRMHLASAVGDNRSCGDVRLSRPLVCVRRLSDNTSSSDVRLSLKSAYFDIYEWNFINEYEVPSLVHPSKWSANARVCLRSYYRLLYNRVRPHVR